VRRETQDVPIEGERRFDVGDGDTNMRDAGAIRQAIPPSKRVESVSITGE